jgi:hypothetical protein
MAREASNRNVVVIDPKLVMDRFLHYRERHQGWHIFKTMYWSIFFVVVGIFLLYYNQIGFGITLFFGAVSLLFAVMLILFGLTEALHHKLMRRYG